MELPWDSLLAGSVVNGGSKWTWSKFPKSLCLMQTVMVDLTLSVGPIAATLELRALGNSQMPPLQVSYAAHMGHQLGLSLTFCSTLCEGLFLNRQILNSQSISPTRVLPFSQAPASDKILLPKAGCGFLFLFLFLLILMTFLFHFSWIWTTFLSQWLLLRTHWPLVSLPHSFLVVY